MPTPDSIQGNTTQDTPRTTASNYKIIEVTGSEGLRYSGAIGTTQGIRSISGVIPKSGIVIYNEGTNGILSATFQKESDLGIITAQIKKGDRILATQTTFAAYGIVTVSN